MHCYRPSAMIHEGTTNRTFMSHKFWSSSHFWPSNLFVEITSKEVKHYLIDDLSRPEFDELNLKKKFMKKSISGLCFLIMSMQWSYAQPTETIKSAANNTPEQQEIINLSRQKWNWMADKNVDSLNVLFDDKSMFVHMGGSWGKTQELSTIKSGGIWYKKAEVYAVIVNIIGNTAILLNDIDLVAEVGGREVTNPFMVTEVYLKENGKWKMGSLTFSHLMRPVKMK
jgi:uncharacterized protein DUF4440